MENWEWYENCPQNRHKVVTLLSGEAETENYEVDHDLQVRFPRDHPIGRSRSLFCLSRALGRQWSRRIAAIPVLFAVPGCPNYGEEFTGTWSSWIRKVFHRTI
jgi:hypothetical protein